MNQNQEQTIQVTVQWEHFLTEPVVDLQQALAFVDGDGDILHDVVALFLEDYPQYAAALQRGLAVADAAAVRDAAHWLKGGLGNVGSRPAYELACDIEQMALAGNLPAATLLFEVLKVELSRLAVFYSQPNWRERYNV